MTNKLPCAVVRDLLPSYLEGLTEPESTRLVEEHLAECAACAAHRDAMRPDAVSEQQEESRQVDYLCAVRRKGRHKILLAVICTILVVLLAVCAKLFLIGSRVDAEDFNTVSYSMRFDPNDAARMDVEFFQTSSGISFAGWKTSIKNGELHIEARKVLASPLNTSGSYVCSLDLTGIDQIYAFGELIWQNGLAIPAQTGRMYRARTPYVGSMYKVAAAAATLPLPIRDLSWELRTDAEPYGVILHFTDPLPLADQQLMKRDAALLLALVDNLSEVYWTYPDLDGGERSEVLRMDEFNASLPDLAAQYNASHKTQLTALASVKDYAADLYTFQQLRELVEQNCDSPLINLSSF